MIVIDASTIVSRALKDENSSRADAALSYAADHGALVPGNFQTEIVNAIVKAERRGRLDQLKSGLILSEIANMPLQAVFPDPHAVLAAARTHGLTAYDAAYLALAMQQRCRLATVDVTLAAAAQKAGCEWRPA
ncbi:MAG TPA: type II toxin-antitoxin system VapC family toxin [Candidatus Baltobacteraceae bacterium]|nr:type II toxin-antitoxin system VapC family toxin [Candidatus Baltobacteraceae bacterium]